MRGGAPGGGLPPPPKNGGSSLRDSPLLDPLPWCLPFGGCIYLLVILVDSPVHGMTGGGRGGCRGGPPPAPLHLLSSEAEN